MEVLVRAHTARRRLNKKRRRSGRVLEPSKFTIIFDTETTTDPSQRLRFGTFQLRIGPDLVKAGFFYEPEELAPTELKLLKGYARRRRLVAMTRAEFVTEILVPIGFGRRGRIVGLNLGFDLSRLRIDHDTARARSDQDPFGGGFTYKIHDAPWIPRIRHTKTTGTSSFYEFTQPDGRSPQQRGAKGPPPRGFFIDVATAAAAMLGEKYSLARLCQVLDTPTKKLDRQDHGQQLTAEYLGYAVADTQSTWECFVALKAQWRATRLEGYVPLHRLHSEASITKALLSAFGVVPWRRTQPDAPEHLAAKAMEAYYGGRTQIGVRCHAMPQVLVDFTSQYPAVFALQRLWPFMTATETRWHKPALADVRDLLDNLNADTLLEPETWPKLNVLVKVRPDGDLLPTRARYAPSGQPNVGLSFRSGEAQWFTLADVAAAKLLNAKTPHVVDAVAFEPGEPQSGLDVAYIGLEDAGQRLDPHACIPVWLVETRARIQQQRTEAETAGDDATAAVLAGTAQSVKAAVNSLYGVCIELNAVTHSEAKDATIVTPGGTRYKCRTGRSEYPGTYYHPVVATLVAAGGRLLLGLLQHLVETNGGSLGFCDTDSGSIVATAKGGPTGCPGGTHRTPDGAPAIHALSHQQVLEIVERFDALSPYDQELIPHFLKVENGIDEQVWFWGVSAKRYALFTRDDDKIEFVFKSEHGLGHITPPKGLTRDDYYHEVWMAVLSEGLGIDYDEPDWFDEPALGSLTATTPAEVKNFAAYNRDKEYSERLGPMNFVATAHPHGTAQGEVHSGILIAPYGTEPSDPRWVDRGRPEAMTAITTAHPMYVVEGHIPVLSHRDLIEAHGHHPEAKALDQTGEPCTGASRGLLAPRQIEATELIRCGKEANRYTDNPNAWDPATADGVTQYREPLCRRCKAQVDHRGGRQYCSESCRKRFARAHSSLTTS